DPPPAGSSSSVSPTSPTEFRVSASNAGTAATHVFTAVEEVIFAADTLLQATRTLGDGGATLASRFCTGFAGEAGTLMTWRMVDTNGDRLLSPGDQILIEQPSPCRGVVRSFSMTLGVVPLLGAVGGSVTTR